MHEHQLIGDKPTGWSDTLCNSVALELFAVQPVS